MSELPLKKAKSTMKIGTHNGTFHCDEVFACHMLKLLPQYKDAEIVRTRDQALLDGCDIVVDVGGVFDPEKHRYDHHQRTFSESMNSLKLEKKWVTKLSSAGLVYLHFGQDVLKEIIAKKSLDCSQELIDKLYDKVYEFFVEEIDAIDNGIHQTDGKPRFATTTGLSSRVGNLNPRWNEDIGKDRAAFEMNRFTQAMRMVGEEFEDRIDYYATSWWPARTLVANAIQNRHNVDESGEIINLSEGGCPWKDHLFTMEEELNIKPTIKFVLYSDTNGKWRVQCVPEMLGSFNNRLSLMEEWKGIRDEKLSEISGIPGCVFVHANGFIGGNNTYEGVLEMSRQTLKARKD
ncbi:MYG1 exonuclease-like [Lineus longissimus]|uniref:MYG1 exonuclease-like n=1 Tax=Lineus longissimus TaxID=88925 RepID=UPI002B4DCDF7